jgi:hypothetical protein
MYQQAPRGGKHVVMGGQGARIHIDIYVGQGAEERTKYPRSIVPYKALYHARLHTLVPCRPTASRATTPPIAPRNAAAADTRRPFRCSRPHKIAVLRSIRRPPACSTSCCVVRYVVPDHSGRRRTAPFTTANVAGTRRFGLRGPPGCSSHSRTPAEYARRSRTWR